MTGIDYPTVTIGGRALIVKFSAAAQLLMRRRGLDIRKVPSAIAPRQHPDGTGCVNPQCEQTEHTPNLKAEDNIMRVFSCMVVHEFVSLDNPAVVSLDDAPSADYWALVIKDEEDFAAIELAVWVALGKALEARRTQLQVVSPLSESLAS